ncbi:universal stress protein [Rhodoferax sp.]|uniref:universal stress protein n=1 Tax=Rhodoferax sp. TaxID=50421 RepID=UPI002751C34B|nr:universal stress protein [Rhodoferax sp.]
MSVHANPEPVPTPAEERHDDIGRLVALSWHSAGFGVGAERARWLVAVDGSACALRALEMAVRLATLGRDTEVELVHVQPWLNKEAAQAELARRAWVATDAARQLLGEASLNWRLHVLMGEAAPEIAGLSDTLHSHGIAIGSHGLNAAQSLLLGSVANKVVHLAKRPVLIVR